MGLSLKVVLSYAFDWVIIVVLGVIALCLGFIPGNKRPFSLNDPNISYVAPAFTNILANNV